MEKLNLCSYLLTGGLAYKTYSSRFLCTFCFAAVLLAPQQLTLVGARRGGCYVGARTVVSSSHVLPSNTSLSIPDSSYYCIVVMANFIVMASTNNLHCAQDATVQGRPSGISKFFRSLGLIVQLIITVLFLGFSEALANIIMFLLLHSCRQLDQFLAHYYMQVCELNMSEFYHKMHYSYKGKGCSWMHISLRSRYIASMHACMWDP